MNARIGPVLLAVTMFAACHDMTAVTPPDQNEDDPMDPPATFPDAAMMEPIDPIEDAGVIDPPPADAGEIVEEPDAGEIMMPDPGCIFDETPFDTATLQGRVTFFASDSLEGRAPGTPGDVATRMLIEDRFRCLGLSAPGGNYQQTFVTSEGKTTANVIGYIPGSDPAVADQQIVVGAHHDHLGIRNGRIYNGANDNASGVAAMLAIAQSIKQSGTAPRRTIVFVAFGFEEHDGECEGSEYYVANPPQGLPIDRVVYMIDFDMVATYALAEELTVYGASMATPGRAAMQQLAGAYPQLDMDLDAEADEDASDFQAFCDVEVPYIYFETWDDDCYHQGCDDSGRLDYTNMALISRLGLDLIRELGDTTDDLAAARAQTGCVGP